MHAPVCPLSPNCPYCDDAGKGEIDPPEFEDMKPAGEERLDDMGEETPLPVCPACGGRGFHEWNCPLNRASEAESRQALIASYRALRAPLPFSLEKHEKEGA